MLPLVFLGEIFPENSFIFTSNQYDFESNLFTNNQ